MFNGSIKWIEILFQPEAPWELNSLRKDIPRDDEITSEKEGLVYRPDKWPGTTEYKLLNEWLKSWNVKRIKIIANGGLGAEHDPDCDGNCLKRSNGSNATCCPAYFKNVSWIELS